jgi:hypothetical protein
VDTARTKGASSLHMGSEYLPTPVDYSMVVAKMKELYEEIEEEDLRIEDYHLLRVVNERAPSTGGVNPKLCFKTKAIDEKYHRTKPGEVSYAIVSKDKRDSKVKAVGGSSVDAEMKLAHGVKNVRDTTTTALLTKNEKMAPWMNGFYMVATRHEDVKNCMVQFFDMISKRIPRSSVISSEQSRELVKREIKALYAEICQDPQCISLPAGLIVGNGSKTDAHPQKQSMTEHFWVKAADGRKMKVPAGEAAEMQDSVEICTTEPCGKKNRIPAGTWLKVYKVNLTEPPGFEETITVYEDQDKNTMTTIRFKHFLAKDEALPPIEENLPTVETDSD